MKTFSPPLKRQAMLKEEVHMSGEQVVFTDGQ